MTETWKDIPNCKDYQVSDLGRVRSKDRLIKPGRGKNYRKRTGIILKHSLDGNGYCQVNLVGDAPKGLTRKVHRLVMMAFVGESNLGVNHRDGNKQNNRLSNLEYMTHSENHIHARKVLKKLVGDKHWNHRFSDEDIKNMKQQYLLGQVRVKEIKEKFGCCVGHFYTLIK